MAGYGGRLDLQNMEVLWKYRVKDELENRGQVPGDYIVHWGGILAYPSGERLCGGQFAETLSTQNLNRLRPQLITISAGGVKVKESMLHKLSVLIEEVY